MERLIEIYLLSTEKLEDKAEAVLPTIAPYYANKYKRAKAASVKTQELAAGYILRKCLGVNADDQLIFGEQGKPSLNRENIDCDKEFNLSHSGKYVVLAVSDGPVGVDIERISRVTLPVLKHVLPPEYYLKIEKETKEAANDTEVRFTMGKGWTALEAVLKASGTGFITDDFGNDGFFDDWFVESMKIEDEYILSCASKVPFKLSLNELEV